MQRAFLKLERAQTATKPHQQRTNKGRRASFQIAATGRTLGTRIALPKRQKVRDIKKENKEQKVVSASKRLGATICLLYTDFLLAGLAAEPMGVKGGAAMRALGLEYVLENIPPTRIGTFGPSGKVPLLVYEGVSLNESERIVKAIELHAEPTSYPQPTDQNHKDGIAFMRLVEDHLYHIICLSKYTNKESSNLMIAEMYSELPRNRYKPHGSDCGTSNEKKR